VRDLSPALPGFVNWGEDEEEPRISRINADVTKLISIAAIRDNPGPAIREGPNRLPG
jgi:hypothetical protein